MTEQTAPMPPANPDTETVAFTLDGRPATGRAGELLISAAERAGVYIPRFCYHPRMEPVGMCRMCLVEVSGPRGATLQPACFISVEAGSEVVTTSEKVKKAQDGVLEFLLVNHPLDCPVCDKGGECPLQDQTLAYGPGESRFIEEKRHFEKPIAISDLVLLDRERCIQCARCTRFAEEIAGEAQIDFAGRGERVEVANFPTEPFSSYFSGNTVQICPVGALTATPYRFTARPWDLDQVESTCTTCALGCRVAVQSSANRLTRLLGLDSEPVNHSWLCDKGRFAFEAVNGDEVSAGPDEDAPAVTLGSGRPRGQFAGEVAETASQVGRVTEPMVRQGDRHRQVSWSEALVEAASRLDAVRRAHGPEAIAFIGGGRLTNEGAYAWTKLAKGVIGTDSVDAQVGDGLPAELVLSLPRATIDEACAAQLVVLLSGDVREELPVLFLRLRRAILDKRTALVELTPRSTSLTRYAEVSLTVRPGDGPLVARALAGEQAALPAHPTGPSFATEDLDAARRLAGDAGRSGAGIVVLYSRPSLAEGASVSAAAVATLAAAWPDAKFLPLLRRGNVHGALDMGMAPGILPGRTSLEQGERWFAERWGSVPSARGRDTTQVLRSLAERDDDATRALVLLGCDPLEDFPDRSLAKRALEAADLVISVAGHPGPSLDLADVVLPVAVAHERPGTTTNVEGRVTRLGQKLAPPGLAWPDWTIASALSDELGYDLAIGTPAEIADEIERVAPAYRGFAPGFLDQVSGHDGIVVPLGAAPVPAVQPIDPMAIPGVESVERQGAPPRVGLTESLSREVLAALHPNEGSADEPALLRRAGPTPVSVPPPDHYSLRLVSTRRLYDRGSAVTASPSLAQLVGPATAFANPSDLARLGVGPGERVRVSSPRGQVTLPAAGDPGVPKGVLVVDFNLAEPDGAPNAAAVLIDASAMVNDVRLETL